MKKSGKAVVFTGSGRTLQTSSFQLPDLQEGEVLVKILNCSICGSDLHSFLGRRPTPTPSVLGHEIVGTIFQTFKGETLRDYTGKEISKGDLITWSLSVSCGKCLFCRKGFPQKCEKLLKYGHLKQDAPFMFNGGFAEFIHLQKGTAIFKLNPKLPIEYLSALNCSFATVAAAIRNAGEVKNKAALIFGAGMLGVVCAAMLKKLGASTILAIDLNETRLDIIRHFGADRTILWNDAKRLSGELKKHMNIDLVFEMSGSNEATSLAFDFMGIGSQLVLCGSVFPAGNISVSPEKIVRNLWQIKGIHNYHPDDLLTAIRFFESEYLNYPFELLFYKKSFSLKDISFALDLAEKSIAYRISITP